IAAARRRDIRPQDHHHLLPRADRGRSRGREALRRGGARSQSARARAAATRTGDGRLCRSRQAPKAEDRRLKPNSAAPPPLRWHELSAARRLGYARAFGEAHMDEASHARELAEPAVPSPRRIAYRHRLPTRIWHWVNAITVIV